MIDWEEVRNRFPLVRSCTYLNTARFGAMPKGGISAQKDFLEHMSTYGPTKFEVWDQKYEESRRMVAKLLEVDKGDIFFLPDVSTGMNIACAYLPKRAVILVKNDFESVSLPWETHGFSTVYLNVREDDFYNKLEASLKSSPKILAVSWVQSYDGHEVDLKTTFELCKKYDTILILDGTQGLGAIPIKIDLDVNCIFLCSGFKWLMAGYGIAIGYVSNNLKEFFKPYTGWHSIDFSNGNIKDDLSSLEAGHGKYGPVLSLYEGLKIINELTVENILERISRLRKYLASGSSTNHIISNKHGNSGIVTFHDPIQNDARLHITKYSEGGRLSINFYNNNKDLDKFLSWSL